MKFNKVKMAGIALIAIAVLAGCETDRSGANGKETRAARSQLDVYLQSQPIPQFSSSQLRQNLIEIETAQVKTTATTSFFFNQGVQDPISSCPSVGFPIPTTAQLTNPETKYSGKNFTVPQAEANGVYTGDSSGTYVICALDTGVTYAQYWEGFVSTVTGPATWDQTKHQIVLTGAATGGFTAKTG